MPYHVDAECTLQDIVQKLAPMEPQKGGGGKTAIDVWMNYSTFGVQFEFPVRSWQHGDVRWSEMTIFEPEVEEE